MFSHPSKPGPEYTVGQRATKLWRDFVRAWFDSKADLAAVQRLGQEAKGAPLAPDEMAYELSRLNPHMAARVRVDEQLKPAIQLVGKDQPYLSVYLTHMHNVDIADALGNEARMFSGGLTAEDARAGIDDLRVALGRQRFERVQQAAQQVWDFGDDMRRRLYESGAISESLYNELGRKYPHWVKTTILDYLRDPQRVPPGQKVGLNDPGLRRLTVEGTVRDREDPLASMVRVAYQTESVARRNQVFSALVRLTEGSPDLRQVVRQVETGYSPTRNELTVRGFVDGERRTYAMPSDLANAVEFESQAAIPVITPLMSLFRALATARNPLFLSANAFRDAASYTIRASMREGGPQHLPRVIYALGQAYGDAFKGLRTGEYKGAATARYLREGGGQFGFFQPGQQEAAAELARLSRSSVFQVNSKADLLRIAKDIAKAEPVMAVGERIELAPRVAQMGLAERRGANVVEAVIEGRSVTLDFSQGGTFARFLNQFVPFFNVGLQGLAQPFRAAKEHPLGFVTTGFTLLAGGTVAAEAWNRSDPQRARDYDDVPSYIKDQGVVLMWPGEAPVDAQGNRHPQFVLIRVSEYAPITIATREAVSRALGDDPRTWASLIGGTAQAVSPVQGTNAADLISSVNPFLLNTALQVALDRDLFRDRKIATEWADEQASTASNALARALGVRPSQVEFAIRDLAGGPGAMALEASDVLAGRQQERAAGPQAVPIIGQAIGRVVKGTIGGRLEREQERLLTRESRQVIAEMDVRYAPQPVRGEIKGIPLRLEERERLQRLTNQYVNEAIAGLGGLGDWGEVPSDARQRILERAIAGARAQAANEVLASVNDIATRKARAR